MMRVAGDVDSYLAEPVGAYVVVPRALVFCARPTLWGFALWGRPTAAEVARVITLLGRELASDVPPHASLVDVGRLESSDPRAFGALVAYLQRNFDAFRTRITRLALVRPPGVVGATVAGFFQVAGTPYPVRVFEDARSAAAWLRAGDLAAVITRAIAHATALPESVVHVQRWVDANLDDATIARAARALSRAPRTLQRELARAGTTFQREVDAARVRLAKRLLVDSDSSLTEIAYDVGCASPQHFSTLFRRVTGRTPSAWRRDTPSDS